MSVSLDTASAAPGGAARPRSPWIAALLSLLMPGLGQVYVGEARRGVGIMVVALVAQWSLVDRLFGAEPRFWTAALLLATWLALFVAALIDAVNTARAITHYQPKRYNTWFVYAGALAIAIVLNVVGCLYISDAGTVGPTFRVESAGMAPTLLRGDIILAGLDHYRRHAPIRGDVAIYAHPKQPGEHSIKRIVALPGERIVIRDGRAVVNGVPLEEPHADFGDPRAFYNNTREVTVPEGYVFVLGDNRANSMDSRAAAAHGPVPITNLHARATDVVLSREPSRIGRWVGTPAR